MAVDDDAPEQQLSQSATSGPADEDSTDQAIDVLNHDSVDTGHREDDDGGVGAQPASAGRGGSRPRAAMLVGVLAALAVAGVGGWFGYRGYQAYRDDAQRQLFLQVGRQGALNLTTIDYQHAEADIQRILDSATGTFYDDFDKRSQPFIEVVKKAQSTSVGTITQAGIESETANEAQVLVAVSVKTTNIGAQDQAPRAWRMRISVTQVDDQAKVSNVAFVP